MAEAGPAGRVRRASLRLRITAAAVLAVALVLGLFTLVFALVQRAVLADAPRTAASTDVSRVVSALEGGATPAQAVAGEADDAVVAVLDPSGAVVAAGGDDDLVALVRAGALSAATSGQRVRLDDGDLVVEVDDALDDDDDEDDDDDGGEAATSAVDRERWRVVAARSLEEAQAASGASLATLGVAVPVAVLVLGLTTWFVVGRALRPVDAMRREADGIDAARLDRRLADPGGGDEIARLARTLNGMLDRLDASARTQRRFVGDASHELRSPLAVIRQHAEVALLHPDRIDGAALAGTVLGEEARLTALVQGLLVLARADEGALRVQAVPVDLDDLVGAEASRLRASGRVRVDATGVGPARVLGDAGLLGQVVRNLVDNAARHARTTVALSLAEHDGRVELMVDDDGAGIAPADRERVLERFVRLDEARDRDAGGSGLGLAIVRELVAVHAGRLTVQASPLGGARFAVTLPAAS